MSAPPLTGDPTVGRTTEPGQGHRPSDGGSREQQAQDTDYLPSRAAAEVLQPQQDIQTET